MGESPHRSVGRDSLSRRGDAFSAGHTGPALRDSGSAAPTGRRGRRPLQTRIPADPAMAGRARRALERCGSCVLLMAKRCRCTLCTASRFDDGKAGETCLGKVRIVRPADDETVPLYFVYSKPTRRWQGGQDVPWKGADRASCRWRNSAAVLCVQQAGSAMAGRARRAFTWCRPPASAPQYRACSGTAGSSPDRSPPRTHRAPRSRRSRP